MPAASSSTSVNCILSNLAAICRFLATYAREGSPLSAICGFETVEVPEMSLPEMSHSLITDSSMISKGIVKIEMPSRSVRTIIAELTLLAAAKLESGNFQENSLSLLFRLTQKCSF
jgi:hypothetical protein